MDIEEIQESAEYTLLTLLTSIGGDLSLYIGITFASFFEFFEFLIRLFMALF